MTLTPSLLRRQVIEPCLNDMALVTGKPSLASPESVAMLLATASVESGCGLYLAQQPNNGPAQGIWQLECWASATAQDVLRRRAVPNAALYGLWMKWADVPWDSLSILGNPKHVDRLSRLLMANHHACCMLARLRYLDYEPPMPALDPPDGRETWLSAASATWSNGYWRGADRYAGERYFRSKLAKAADVLAEVEAIRDESTL